MTFRRALQTFRPLRTSVGKPQSWRQIGRRGYASHGHETKKASSDIPWAIGAIAFTVPSVWYILQPGSKNAHGHEDHHDGHGDEHEEEKSEEDSEDSDKADQKSDDFDDEKGPNTPMKGEDSDDEKDDQGDSEGDDGKTQSNDELVSSKPAGGQNSQSGKQENLSNADTKHSTDFEGKSKKGDGSPETSKSKGTVDPKRPQLDE